jgi:type IV fimbrial biogenesis protein FimT
MLRIRPHRSMQKGFNIMELMVTLAVGSILLSIGVPAFKDFMDNNRMAAAANELNISLHMARTEAVKRRANVSICPSSNWNSPTAACNVGGDLDDGWLVFVDSIPPAAPNLSTDGAANIIFAHGPLPPKIGVTSADASDVIAGSTFVSFSPSGFPLAQVGGNNGALNFQFCDDRGDFDIGGGIAAGRWIQLTPTGRPQLHRTQNSVQSAQNPTNGCS